MAETAEIRGRLLALRDEPYAAFQRRLIPGLPPENIIGVRTPALRALARELAGTAQARLESWTRRRAIQKALESRRIDGARKAELREIRARL